MSSAMMINAPSTSALARSTPAASRPVFRSLPALPRRSLIVRASPDTDKSPIDQVADVVEEKAQGFVKATQENSGLDFGNLGKQPGQKPDLPGLGKGDQLQEIQSFTGLAPEIINGRGAMLGMLAAFGAELRTHQPVLVQIQQTPLPILAAFATVIVASLVPILRGADLNRDGAGPFTQRAEVWNGRLAMVSFALLLAVETFKAGPGLVP